MVTIKDVARLSGCSVSTVSRVINNFHYVDEEKRQKVLQVMEELHYYPNRSAQNLNFGQTKNLGVIVPFIHHPYFEGIINGITRCAFTHGYKITLLPTNYDKKIELTYLKELPSKGVDGLIIISRANDLSTILSFARFGAIVLCEDCEEEAIGSVFINREKSYEEVFRFMKNRGVSKLGLTLGGRQKESVSAKITLEVCLKIFPEFEPENIYWDCLSFEDGKQAAEFFEKKR